jgi:ACS family D-galactonate transporter-like MFS transporter
MKSDVPLSPFPKRWRLATLMGVGIAVSYVDRINISHAIVSMRESLALTSIQQAVVLSAFSWGYVLFMMISGLIVDRIGPIKVIALAAALWSLATIWTGACLGFVSLLLSRIAIGIFEAPLFPSNAKLVREEFPLLERGRATALFDSGSYIGISLSAPLVVYSTAYMGWRFSFYACGMMGLLWVAVWAAAAQGLREYLFASEDSPDTVGRVGWFFLLRQRKVVGASLGFFGYNYHKSFFLTWFPLYLVNERKISFLSMAWIGIIPSLCALFGEGLGGFATDGLLRRGASLTVARKLPLCAGLIIASSVALATQIKSDYLAISLISFAFLGLISTSSVIWALPGDIAPDSGYVGTIGGLQNAVSNIAGIVSPLVTGVLFAHFNSFAPALYVVAFVAVGGMLSYWLIMDAVEPIDLALTDRAVSFRSQS